MASHDDDQDLVVYGTPIEREEDVSARKRRGVAEAGQLRTLPAWKQEVRDEEGRRRFHGAFTGGFSAGFYNTAGSKDGWTPQTFTSSRKSRAEHKKQSIYNFLDEEDIKDMGGNALETSQQYDTFGFTAAEHARKQASKEQNERPSAIPGPVPDEFVVPATTSIGVKLLMKMGWRQGRTIKDAHADSLYESRREARKAFLALSGISNNEDQDRVSSQKSRDENVAESFDDMRASGNTPVYVLHPKEDLHGLGFDPFKHAPEFEDRKRSQKSPSKKAGDSKFKLEDRKRGVFLSFKIASNSEYKLERFHPPEIPADFDGHHKFSSPIQAADKFSDLAPPEVPPPEDTTLRLLIDGCAAMVARCGKHIEDFYKEKSKASPQFLFLDGGDGCSYYARKLWEHQQKFIGQQRPDSVKSKPSSDKLTAENRGNILGERPLDRSSKSSSTSFSAKEAVQLQSNLGDTFVKPISLDAVPDSKKPFRNEPAKQARFEQFLKEKYQGGLRLANLVPTSSMSEADRARERLDFEAAADAIEKGKEYKAIDPISLLGLNEQRFVSSTQLESSAVPRDEKPMLPQREEFEWRPSPILCKRFDIVDPFMGKPMPLRRPISKMDSPMFMTESTKRTNDDVKSSSGIPQSTSAGGIEQTEAQGTANDPDIVPSSMERPVDLYKAIFSDDSDDDMDEPLNNKPVDPVKTSEGANMALNRLVAEDFLESLGKELGLEVPAEKPVPPPNVFRSEILPTADRSVSRNGKTTSREIKENESPFDLMEADKSNGDGPSSNIEKLDSKYEKQEHRAEKGRSHSSRRHIRNGSTESDTDTERHRSRKRRSHHKIRSATPDSDSSGEQRRSKKRKSHSRHRTGRSRTPDADSSSDSQKNKRKRQEKRSHRTLTPDIDSSDHGYTEKYTSSSRRSSDKDRSRKRSRHHRHRREDPA
uniref:Uncharacterized protein n=1 Tax=Avena sativa TaxID=4498 RepID=A0ACD6AJX0_AVESA